MLWQTRRYNDPTTSHLYIRHLELHVRAILIAAWISCPFKKYMWDDTTLFSGRIKFGKTNFLMKRPKHQQNNCFVNHSIPSFILLFQIIRNLWRHSDAVYRYYTQNNLDLPNNNVKVYSTKQHSKVMKIICRWIRILLGFVVFKTKKSPCNDDINLTCNTP